MEVTRITSFLVLLLFSCVYSLRSLAFMPPFCSANGPAHQIKLAYFVRGLIVRPRDSFRFIQVAFDICQPSFYDLIMSRRAYYFCCPTSEGDQQDNNGSWCNEIGSWNKQGAFFAYYTTSCVLRPVIIIIIIMEKIVLVCLLKFYCLENTALLCWRLLVSVYGRMAYARLSIYIA